MTGIVFPPGINSWQTSCKNKNKEAVPCGFHTSQLFYHYLIRDEYLSHDILIVGQRQTQISYIAIITLHKHTIRYRKVVSWRHRCGKITLEFRIYSWPWWRWGSCRTLSPARAAHRWSCRKCCGGDQVLDSGRRRQKEHPQLCPAHANLTVTHPRKGAQSKNHQRSFLLSPTS